MWCAIAIHDTSSVVGTAVDYGDEALRIATTVKLSRTLWIIPLSIFSMFFFKRKKEQIKIPYFIVLFIFTIFINSSEILPSTATLYCISIQTIIGSHLIFGRNDTFHQGFKNRWYKTNILSNDIMVFHFSIFSPIYCALRIVN